MGTDTILGSTDLVMSGVGGWFGGFDGLFHALVAFVVADYVSGVLAAVSERRLSSSAGFRGISRKILIFTFVCFAHVLDTYALGGSGVLRTATIFFYISNEGISLIENATRLGLPVPASIREALDLVANRKNRRPPLTEQPQPPITGGD